MPSPIGAVLVGVQCKSHNESYAAPARTRNERRRKRQAMALKAGAEDALLTAAECGALLGGMSEQRFPRYAGAWPVLRQGMRIVRVRAGTRGRARWLKSAVIEHLRSELLCPELREPDPD